MRNANERLTGRWRDICLLALVVTSVAALQAQNTPASPQAVQFQVLADFDGTDGSGPGADLQAVMQGPDGNLYGAAEGGGAYNNGVIFKLTPEGTLTTLYSFCPQPDCADGQYPGTPVLAPTAPSTEQPATTEPSTRARSSGLRWRANSRPSTTSRMAPTIGGSPWASTGTFTEPQQAAGRTAKGRFSRSPRTAT